MKMGHNLKKIVSRGVSLVGNNVDFNKYSKFECYISNGFHVMDKSAYFV
jgi:hypothetical protein